MLKLWDYKFVSEYAAMLKKARAFFEAHPDGRITLLSFGRELDRAAFKKEIWVALDRRINLKGGLGQDSRKYSDAYQVGLLRDARAIRQHFKHRVICRHLETKELKKRYSHILFDSYE